MKIQNGLINKLKPYAIALGLITLIGGATIPKVAAEYKTSPSVMSKLRVIAGIYVGSIRVIKTEKGYTARGFYSQVANPEEMEQAMKDADTDDNEIITEKEASKRMIDVFKEYSK